MEPSPDVPQWVISTIAVVFLIGIFTLIGYFYYRDKRRWERFAKRLGFKVHEFDSGSVTIPEEFHLKDCWRGEGHIRRTAEGSREGATAAIVEYGFHGNKGESVGYPLHLVYLRIARLGLPLFHLQPEKWRHRLAEVLGSRDVDFPESSRFSRRFRLRGLDEPGIRKTFTEPVRRFFEHHPGTFCEGYEDILIYYRPTRMLRLFKFRPTHAERLLREALEVVNLFREQNP